MKFAALTTAAALLALAMASPVAAETQGSTISDSSKQATIEALGVDPATTGATDEERRTFFMAMSVQDRSAMHDKCTLYIGREPTETANDVASESAMSFCNVVVAPQ